MINLNDTPFSLQGKNIMITGASSGIGRACAILFSKFSAKVILVARNTDNLNETLSQMDGENHAVYPFDLKNIHKIESLMNEIYKKTGTISGFIHSAGIDKLMPISIVKPSSYEEIFTVNLFSALEIIRTMVKSKYLSDKGASLVLISSIMGVVGQPARSAYSATKGAIISAVKSLALEFAPKKIRVNSISPSLVKTNIFNKIEANLGPAKINEMLKYHPLGFGYPQDIANSCVFLLSDASRWITGTNLIVDGGYSAH